MRLLITLLGSLCLASVAPAALITFTDRPTFDAAAPGLLLEDFEDADVVDGVFETIDAPLNSSSSNSAFSPGDIQSGLSIQDQPGPNAGSLIVVAPGVLPTVNRAILINTFADSGELIFLGGVRAVGFDLWTAPAPGSLSSGSVSIEVFDTSNTSLGVFSTTSSTAGGVFWGVTSDSDLIGRISVLSEDNLAETFDNIAFGETEVPEPSTWMSLLLGAGTLAWLRSNRRSA